MKKRKVALLIAAALYFLLYISLSINLFPRATDTDYVDIAIEGSLFVFTFILLVFFQRYRGPYQIYSNFTIGLLLTSFYHCSDMLDELILFPRFLQLIVDDAIHLVSLLFITLGVLRWLTYNNKIMRKLKRLATTDGLTGIHNRQKIDKILELQRASALRYERDLSVILIDVDKFKHINDTYGHSTGDTVLIELCRIIGSSIRETDYLGRYGGEEFLLILPETNIESAELVGEKLRILIAEHAFEQVGTVTASLGVARLKDKERLADFIHRADSALYHSKKSGRNLVSISG